MNYQEACQFMQATAKRGSRPGLQTITRLCALLGNPQEKLNVIHVAGTNGKGSTCRMLAEISRQAGYKIGLFVSPYFENYESSFFIDGNPMPKADFTAVVGKAAKQAQIMAQEGLPPTEFEILTACAFLWFLAQGCSLAVLETGMGGSLDSTNVITAPLASVITAIGLDHTAFLGETIGEIASHKSGVIKQNSIVVCYPDQPQEALSVIRAAAAYKNCLFIQPDTKYDIVKSSLWGTEFKYKGTGYETAMPGIHQVLNATVAIETARALTAHTAFQFPQKTVVSGLANAVMPARQELINESPLILLDGSHNLQGIEALAASIQTHLPEKRIILVMGMLRDKQYEASIGCMAKLCSKFISTLPDNPRALDPHEAARVASSHCGDVLAFPNPAWALDEALRSYREGGAIVICGSLYLAAKIRPLLQEKNLIVKPGRL